MKPSAKLQGIRNNIDVVDDQLIHLLKTRFELVDEVVKIKRELGLESVQPARYQELLRKLEQKAVELDIPPEAVREIWHAIHETSVRYQEGKKPV